MLLRWILAALHLVALGVGAGAVANRSRVLAAPLDAAGLKRVFHADNAWGVAGVLWIGTGLWRLLAQTEKSTAYYLGNHVFWTKMGILALLIALEMWPMMTLVRWRMQVQRGEAVDTSRAPLLARISRIQLALVVAMVFAATAMARGMGS
ncbi:MAG TPA: DUF2214 family protein [Longimicrobium sp.]|nr:DUF2214 family protein [Longimicrobium sp.]